MKERAEGDLLLRGTRGTNTANSLKVSLARVNKAMFEAGMTEKRLSYSRIWLSGIFYRAYCRERAGLPSRIDDIALGLFNDRDRDNQLKRTKVAKQTFLRSTKKDYEDWKAAFDV